jgi:hypothetical protein
MVSGQCRWEDAMCAKVCWVPGDVSRRHRVKCIPVLQMTRVDRTQWGCAMIGSSLHTQQQQQGVGHNRYFFTWCWVMQAVLTLCDSCC